MKPQALVCPGCGGAKSKRAELCLTCRRKANAVGASVLTHVHEAAIPPESLPFVPRTPWQSKAYHGKCNDLARLTGSDFLETKRAALAHAGEMFGRAFDSSTELSEIEMEQLLEWLDDQLIDAKRALAATR